MSLDTVPRSIDGPNDRNLNLGSFGRNHGRAAAHLNVNNAMFDPVADALERPDVPYVFGTGECCQAMGDKLGTMVYNDQISIGTQRWLTGWLMPRALTS